MNNSKLILLYCFILGLIEISTAQEDKVYYDLQEAQENPTAVYGLHIAVDRLEDKERLFMDSLSLFPKLEKLIITNYSFYGGSGKYSGFPMFILKLPKLKILHFEEYDLEAIPEAIKSLKNLEELKLINTRLDKFPESIVALKKLTHLTITKSSFNRITSYYKIPTSISKLRALKTLVIYTESASFPSTFSKLNQLEYLDLSRSSFDTLPKEILKLHRLKELRLSTCNLRIIPDGFGMFPELLKLNLSRNKLEKLPTTFSKLKKLETLYLHRNQFQLFPEVVLGLNELRNLDLSRNEIHKFPIRGTYLKQLTNLNLSYNSLKQFPSWIIDLPNLTDLELLKNNLKALPKEIGALKKIKRINLCLNDLESLPKEIGALSTLETLNCNFCYLKTLPKSILKLEQLKTLNLKYNDLERKPSFLFNSKSRLKLELVGNEYLKDRADKKAKIDDSVGQFTDKRDGQEYTTVQINDQTWMTEDLDFETPNSIVDSISKKNILRSYPLEDLETVCPEGWHNARAADWSALFKEAMTEFPEDPQASYNSKMKEEREVFVDNKEDRTVFFDPDEYHNKSHRVTTYLTVRLGMKKQNQNFYGFNMNLKPFFLRERGKTIKGYVGIGKKKIYWIYGFMARSRNVMERRVDKKKLAKGSFYVRCVKDQ